MAAPTVFKACPRHTQDIGCTTLDAHESGDLTVQNTSVVIPSPSNEPVLTYAPHSPERANLRAALKTLQQEKRDLPMWIDGKAVSCANRENVVMPHRHQHVVGTLHMGDKQHVAQAIDSAMRARAHWQRFPFHERAAIFLRAAELLTTRYRALINAATMVGQSKTAHQAEIDAVCELADFWRFNVAFASRLYAEQPQSAKGTWNRMDYRPLDGFVLAVAPFNFTAIAGNLCTAPAIMGNTVVFKPATTAALSSQIVIDVLTEAGLPPGVINLVHAPGPVVSDVALTHPDLAGVHFTGSTNTFQTMWRRVAENINNFHAYPRLVGETGGKDFVVAHPSADVETLAVALTRGAFEFQGQKCSAASRAYIPESLWQKLAPRLEAEVKGLKMGDVSNFANFMGAVIDERAFARIRGCIQAAREDKDLTFLTGGKCDDSEGYFIEPTVVTTALPKHRLMSEEIFGPVLCIYRYPDKDYAATLRLCNETSPYALTGAIFAQDRAAIDTASEALRFAAGNFYINDKPTGAVVGQQPFGGGRSSGTNDKAGSMLNLVRWTSARVIKETFDAARAVGYPSMLAD